MALDKFLPIFGMLGSLLSSNMSKKDKAPAPAPAAEREVAPKVEEQAESAAMKQKKAVAANRASQALADSPTNETTHGGVSIVGG